MRDRIYSRVLGKVLRIPRSVQAAAAAGGDGVGTAIINSWLSSAEMSRCAASGVKLSIGARLRAVRPDDPSAARRHRRSRASATADEAAIEAMILSYREYGASLGLRPETLDSHATSLRGHVLPCALGGGRVASPAPSSGRRTTVPPSQWARVLSRSLVPFCLARGVSPGDIRKASAVASRLVDWLAASGSIPADAVYHAPPLPARRVAGAAKLAAPRLLTPSDVALIADRMKSPAATAGGFEKIWTIVALMVAYAVRPGEAAAVLKDDIAEDRTLYVARQMTTTGERPPKAESVGAVAPIPERADLAARAAAALETLESQAKGLRPHFLKPRQAHALWAEARVGTPLEDFTLKDFRREAALYFYGRRLGEEGGAGDALTLTARLLRHSNILTTSCYLRLR